MVEVYLWTGFPGHLSLKVDGGNPPGPMYLSRFPATQLAKLAGTGVDQNYAQDLAEYGAPHIARLSKLDETAVKKAVMLAQKTMFYSVPAANCASHVKFCLDSGVGGLAVISVRGAIGFAISDTPWGVYAYAQSLRALYG